MDYHPKSDASGVGTIVGSIGSGVGSCVGSAVGSGRTPGSGVA